LTVFTDSVDSVDVVCKGLSNEAAKVGDSFGRLVWLVVSSLMDAILRIPPLDNLVELAVLVMTFPAKTLSALSGTFSRRAAEEGGSREESG
jgi:hypothetical protein